MDILALISTPIPAYFTLGPLIVLLVLLSVLIKKSGSTSPLVTAPPVTPVQTAPSQPVVAAPQVTQVSPQVPTPTPAPVEAAIPPISSWKPAEPVAMPQEAPAPVQTPAPQVAAQATEAPQTAAPVAAKPTF